MIYVKPRRKMSVERMRRQQGKHHDLRYRSWKIPRDALDTGYPEVLEFMMTEMLEMFKREVFLWNVWRKAPLSHIYIFRDHDIDFNQERVLLEVRRLPKK